MLLKLQAVLCFLVLGPLGFCRGAEKIEATYLKPIEVKAKKSTKKSIGISENSAETLDYDNRETPSLTQVLQKKPSLYVQESGTIGSPRIVLRSQDSNQNRYFLNGVPLTDAQYNSEQIALLNMQAVKAIDVYSDCIPVALGTDGLGGALDFKLDLAQENRISVKSGNYGFGEIFGKMVLGRGKGNLNLSLLRSNENYSYYDDGGTPLNNNAGEIKTREHNGYFRIGLVPIISILQTSNLDVVYFGVNGFRKLEIPGAVSVPLQGDLTQIFHLSAFSFEKQINERLKNKTLVFGKVDSQKYNSETKDKSLSAPESNQSVDKALGVRNQLTFYHLFPVRVEQVFAGNYENYELRSLQDGTKRLSNSRVELPASLSAHVPIVLGELTPAVMVHSTIYQGVLEKKYLFVSPRLGLEMADLGNVKNLELRFLVGRFFRAPSMQELNGNPFGLASSNELVPEQADKVSSGLSYTIFDSQSWLTSVRVSYTYSLSFSKDLITYVRNSQSSQVATNVGRSIAQNHEGTVELKLFKFGELNTSAVFFSGENLSDLPYHRGKELPNRPKMRLLERAGYQNDRFGLAYQLQWLGERYWDLANLKKMNPTVEHGLFLNVRPPKWGQFNFELLNIFDTFMANSTLSGFQVVDNTTGYLGFPAPGRRIYLSWSYEI